jgi:hypothetical protein
MSVIHRSIQCVTVLAIGQDLPEEAAMFTLLFQLLFNLMNNRITDRIYFSSLSHFPVYIPRSCRSEPFTASRYFYCSVSCLSSFVFIRLACGGISSIQILLSLIHISPKVQKPSWGRSLYCSEFRNANDICLSLFVLQKDMVGRAFCSLHFLRIQFHFCDFAFLVGLVVNILQITMYYCCSNHATYCCGSGNSGVGIATGYGLDGRGVGVRISAGSRIFSSPRCSDRLWGAPNLPSNGYRVKRPGRETDHSHPASAEVKKTWIYISALPYAFMA